LRVSNLFREFSAKHLPISDLSDARERPVFVAKTLKAAVKIFPYYGGAIKNWGK
jgi:hypothetical protein